MKQRTFLLFFISVTLSCNEQNNVVATGKPGKQDDVLAYAYRATYSSDMTVPAHPEYAQMVLKIWKLFESNQIDSMRSYYADTVTYEPADGHRFYGKKDDLLSYAAKDIGSLDSLRFDISCWQSIHINDRNEDWVYIWAAERRYEKNGRADTSLMHEQWKIENNKVSYFNQYKAKPTEK